MSRLLAGFVPLALAAGLWSAPTDEPPKKLTEEGRKELEATWKELNAAGLKAHQAGKVGDAVKAFEEVLKLARQLYTKADFPDGHPNLATSLSNLAALYQDQGKLVEAEPLYREALGMRQRLFKGDHPTVAQSLNNLALLCKDRGKLAEAEPLFLEALAMRKRWFKGDHLAVATSLNSVGTFYQSQGRLTSAEPLLQDALGMRQRLFPGDHPAVATSLNNLAMLYQEQGRMIEAEPLMRDAVAMQKRLFKGDHPDVANSLSNLGFLYKTQGKHAEAEPLYREALAMRQRLFPGDHPAVATTLNNLGQLHQARGKLAEAEPLLQDTLAMRKRLFKGDHPEVAISLNNLASLYHDRGKLTEAEPLYREALGMRQRLFPGDHPAVAGNLNNLASLYKDRGKLADAQPLFQEALAMQKRLYPGDHPLVASNLNNLGFLYADLGKLAEAEPFYQSALAMRKRLVTTYAKQKSEGQALTFAASQPLTRDPYLSMARLRSAREPSFDPGTMYPAVWSTKGMIARVYEQRQLNSRAVATNPAAARQLEALITARRHRAELLLAPPTRDPGARMKREEDLKSLDQQITWLDEQIARSFTPIARVDRLAAATPADLQKALPADAGLVDYIRYTFFEWDNARSAGEQEKRTERYLGFVVSREKVTWVDLDTAAVIDQAAGAWREAITSGKQLVPAIAGKVRELVWEPVQKVLPPGVKTVYVCPDSVLCRLPFAALPGTHPGTVLLEDFAVATIPHAQFLLDQLWPQDERKNAAAGVLVVGGVDYQAEPGTGQAANRDLPVKPDAKGWPALPGAAAEATGVAGAAAKKQLTVTPLRAEKATASAVLSELPKARYAHFATHGFFADPSFRSVFQLDPKQFEMTRRGERIGAAALSPLVMTGLVLAGANNPKTPGRGIVTGEALIDLDLSGLELAVLSACETGLGDVAGGEGTFGLQRAFHLAGTKNVVTSLWKVPDQSTAALMALFYRNLWDKNLAPVEALRQAQLELYRNPGRIAALAEGFRGKFDEVPGAAGKIEGADGKTHPRHWAAFTLSGPGR